MKLTVSTDACMFNKLLETKFEMLLEEYYSTYNTDKFHLISMPLEKLILNYDGFPLIVQNLYDLITNYELLECLFDEVYPCNEHKKITNTHELVSDLKHNCNSIIDVDAKDIATVLVIWLYYLPEPSISKKKISLICDLKCNNKCGEIVNPTDIVSRKMLQRVIKFADFCENQDYSYKKKLGSALSFFLAKHADISKNHKLLRFIENSKNVLMKVELMKNDERYVFDKKYLVVEKTNQDDTVFDKNNLHDKNPCRRSLRNNGLQADTTEINSVTKSSVLIESSNCSVSFSLKGNDCNKLCTDTSTVDKNIIKVQPEGEQLSNIIVYDCSVDVVDEPKNTSQIDDIRWIERTMPIYSNSATKQTKNKSNQNHAKKVLKSGLLSKEDGLLLQNTLELMKILSKIKKVQNQINIKKRNWEEEFGCKNEHVNKHFSDLHYLNDRLESLVNQKNNYLSESGLSYGRLYNRTVLNLKNALKQAFKLYKDRKNNEENVEHLISDIYNIQIILDYLGNNCDNKELPWRSSKGCLGRKKKTKKQLNCVTVVSNLQTIGEHEVIETIPLSLMKSGGAMMTCINAQ